MAETKELIKSIVNGIRERKGKDITIVDMSGKEYASAQGFVICTGTSNMHVDAVADSIRETVEKELGTRPINYDGYRNSEWIVIDYGTIYAHVFLPEYRERYKLEELWNDATIERVPDEEA